MNLQDGGAAARDLKENKAQGKGREGIVDLRAYNFLSSHRGPLPHGMSEEEIDGKDILFADFIGGLLDMDRDRQQFILKKAQAILERKYDGDSSVSSIEPRQILGLVALTCK